MIRSRTGVSHPLILNVASALLLAGFVLFLFYRLLFTNQVLANGDILHYFYPYRDYAANAFRNGELPLWNPYIFMGVPFLANPQAAVLYPLHWPLNWLTVTKQIYWSAAIHAWLLGFGGYCLMGHRRFSAGAALTTGLVLAGSGFYGGMIGHINQMNGAAWLPWTLLIMERWRSGKQHGSATVGWLGLCVALMLLAGHTQTAYINLLGLGLWVIFPTLLLALAALKVPGLTLLAGRETAAEPQNPSQKWWQTLGAQLAIYFGGVLLGVLLSLAQLLPTLELSELGLRQGGLSYGEASSFSLNLSKLPYSLLPSYGFIDLSVTYSTLGYSEFVAYVGLLGLVLAGIGLLRADSPLRLWAVLLAAAGLFLAIGRWNPAYYLFYKVVPGFDLFRTPARWMMLYTMGTAMLAGMGFEQGRRLVEKRLLGKQRWIGKSHLLQMLVLFLIGAELIAAARSLPHTQTTAPQAVTDVRTAVAHLLSDPQRYPQNDQIDPAAAGRFLSMSTITFDPGDMDAYRQLFLEGESPQLDQRAFDQFVVALKSQEILAPNLSMLWRIPSVDGFDGGVLPLKRYIQALSLFISADEIVPDGRLREQVKSVPDTRLLDLLNVQYVITDKVQDLWHEGIYYDRQIGARLTAEPFGESEVDVAIPLPFEATRIDLIGAVILADETSEDASEDMAEETAALLSALEGKVIAAAQVEVFGRGRDAETYELSIGSDTGRGTGSGAGSGAGTASAALWANNQLDSPLADSSGAEVAYRDVEGGRQEYVARIRFDEPLAPELVTVRLTAAWDALWQNLPPALSSGPLLQLQAATLVDERTGMFLPLVTAGRGQMALVHGGDVKIYENVDTLPRGYLAYDVVGVETAADALNAIRNRLSMPSPTNPLRDVQAGARTATPKSKNRWAAVEGLDSFTSSSSPSDRVALVSYQPERIQLHVNSAAEALLVLSDSYYPGWQATVDDAETAIYPVNGLFRGVRVPPGEHTVTFTYQPTTWRYGLWGSAFGLVLLALCFVYRLRLFEKG